MKKQIINQTQILTNRLVDLNNFFQEQTGQFIENIIYIKKTEAERSTITEFELINAGLLEQFLNDHTN